MDNKTLIIQIPTKIKNDLSFLLKLKKPDFACNIDYLLYIIAKIIQIPQFNAKLKNLNKIPMYSKILRYELGKNYKKYLDYLIDNKFIETDNHYVVSTPARLGKCKCYGLTKKYRNTELGDHELTKKSLLTQIIKWKQQTFHNYESDELLMKLYNMMDGFTVDEESASKELDELLSRKEISQHQHDIEINKCKKINDKDNKSMAMFITKDSYNRIHTNFTNISKIIREKYLYHNGIKVQGIDIVSSQASLLGSLFTDYVSTLQETVNNPYLISSDQPVLVDVREKYVNPNNTYEGKAIHIDINRSINLFNYDSAESLIKVISNEIRKYTSVMNIGGIYEFFQDKYDELFDINKPRKEVKKKWISYVFGAPVVENPPTEELYMIHCIWITEFPVLTKILNHFKEYDYKTLAHNLQRKEAELIFTKVCPAIDDELGIEYCTVHDSLLVEEQYCEDVSIIFNRILSENNIMTYVKYEDE